MWPRFEFRSGLICALRLLFVLVLAARHFSPPPPDTSQFPALSFKTTVQCGVYEPLQTIS